MRKHFLLPLLALVLAAASPLRAQNTAIDLAGEWQFFKGDNKTYAKPEFDDALWKPVTLPGSWQSQGNATYKGIAWYRKHITLPADWGNDAIVREGKIVRLDLGGIADAYEVYWNGNLIASNGKFPPNYAPAAGNARAGIPSDKTNFGGDNVLAVRVYGQGAASGIISGPLLIRKPVFADYINVSVVGKDNRTEFTGPEGITFDVLVENQGPAAWQKGTVMLTMLDGAGKTILSSPIQVDVNPNKQSRTTLQLKESELNPGIYTINATTQMGGQAFQTVSKTFVYNPGGIRSSVFRTPEQVQTFNTKLDAFWKTTIAALRNTPIGGSSTLSEAKSTPSVRVYKVSFNALKGQPIYGWLAVPANATKSPGVIVLPGYGNGTVDPPILLAEAGFAALAINVMGAEVDAASYLPDADAYAKGGYNDPNTFVMRSMVSAGLRAVDYLAQRPEVTADRIGVVGVSQGGGLALDVAALDPRVKVVVASSPAADFTRMFAQARKNPASALITGLNPTEKAELDATMAYFDPAFLASRIRVPTMITIGMKDQTVPPETAYTVKNAIPSGVAVSIMADESAGHQVTPSQAASSLNWLKKFLVG